VLSTTESCRRQNRKFLEFFLLTFVQNSSLKISTFLGGFLIRLSSFSKTFFNIFSSFLQDFPWNFPVHKITSKFLPINFLSTSSPNFPQNHANVLPKMLFSEKFSFSQRVSHLFEHTTSHEQVQIENVNNFSSFLPS
jgi:hypothetical protein